MKKNETAHRFAEASISAKLSRESPRNNHIPDHACDHKGDWPAPIAEPVKTLRPKEAATLLGMDAKTLANWRWRGCGPNFIKLPGRGGKGAVRYDRDTVLQWLGGYARKSTSDDGTTGGRRE